MKKVLIDTIDKDNSFLRFDARNLDYIEENGFPAAKGIDSINAETTKKVFFSKGVRGVLNLIDVWLIWRMNRDHFQSDDWYQEFLTEDYLLDNDKKLITFNNMKHWLLDRKYYLVDLVEGIDYIENDIDEAKVSVIQDKEKGRKTRYLFAQQMYKGKTNNFDDTKVESWNMHTISEKGISPEKISLLVTPEGLCDALSIIQYLYLNYPNKNEFRLLSEFIEYINQMEFLEKNILEKK